MEDPVSPSVAQHVLDLSGTELEGRYRLLRLVGAGGMGSVYEGQHVVLGTQVAIKVLKPDLSANEKFRRRFVREAQAASAIRSKHVVRITDFGTTPNGLVYFVMDFLVGRDLEELLNETQRLPWARFRPLLLQIIEALSAAHAKKIVHRDIKPANIYLAEQDGHLEFVKVLDFGIAKINADGNDGLTGTDELFGTVSYMAPELAEGGAATPTSDIYSLGVLMYRVLTGRLPFVGGTPFQILAKHVNENPVPPRDLVAEIPEEVESTILDMMAKKPFLRPTRLLEVLDRLEATPDEERRPLVEQTSGPQPERSDGPGRTEVAITTGPRTVVGVPIIADSGPLPPPAPAPTPVLAPRLEPVAAAGIPAARPRASTEPSPVAMVRKRTLVNPAWAAADLGRSVGAIVSPPQPVAPPRQDAAAVLGSPARGVSNAAGAVGPSVPNVAPEAPQAMAAPAGSSHPLDGVPSVVPVETSSPTDAPPASTSRVEEVDRHGLDPEGGHRRPGGAEESWGEAPRVDVVPGSSQHLGAGAVGEQTRALLFSDDFERTVRSRRTAATRVGVGLIAASVLALGLAIWSSSAEDGKDAERTVLYQAPPAAAATPPSEPDEADVDGPPLPDPAVAAQATEPAGTEAPTAVVGQGAEETPSPPPPPNAVDPPGSKREARKEPAKKPKSGSSSLTDETAMAAIRKKIADQCERGGNGYTVGGIVNDGKLQRIKLSGFEDERTRQCAMKIVGAQRFPKGELRPLKFTL